ncbi:putative O-methyltransferase [Xylaria sp. FL0043]|nr:putative O-methyltransferase [Xylaria sp. FL0043]
MADPRSRAIDLIEQLHSLITTLPSNSDSPVTKDALSLARQLVTALEQPENVAVELAFSPFVSIAARVAVQLNLFQLVASNHGPITSTELVSLSGGEELLIIRVLRAMAATGFVKEAGEKKWGATPLTFAMATEGIAAGHRTLLGRIHCCSWISSPRYFREVGYRCPTDPHDGLIQYAFRTKLPSFELLKTMPEVSDDFNTFMGSTMGARRYWVDWFPVQERLIRGAMNNSALLVDVGGGLGHDVLAFQTRYPNAGRLVLQDLKSVTDEVEGIDPRIEVMGYDFFEVQPVEGARAYFYHHILHDWPDSKCLEILGRVKQAMKPGYSRLLLHEMIMPEEGASPFHAVLDLAMMAFNSGMERTERQWEELTKIAGLKVVKFWSPPQEDGDGIVEIVLEE